MGAQTLKDIKAQYSSELTPAQQAVKVLDEVRAEKAALKLLSEATKKDRDEVKKQLADCSI